MGYTGLHYAVKDAYSLSGVIITISFFTVVAVLLIPVTIIVLIVWVSVRLVQRHKAKQREQLATAASPIDVGPAVTGPCHGVAHPVLYRIRGIDRGAGHVDLFCYDCPCGGTISDTTPGQAAARLQSHLHEGTYWASSSPENQ